MFRVVKLWIALVACVAVLGFFVSLGMQPPLLPEGDHYVFCVGEASSQGDFVVVRKNIAVVKFLLGKVCGESSCYRDDERSELVERYEAKFVFSERNGGILHEYYYSARLGDGILLNGKAVNLHFAYRDGLTFVGTPILFHGC